MVLQESGEMYLETILVLSQKSRFVRAIDIGEEMGFSRPSVSRAVHLLQDGQFIHIAPDGSITLTDVGREIAEKVYERHTVLTRALEAIGVGAETAEEDACKVEHYISDETFAAIRRHLDTFAAKIK